MISAPAAPLVCLGMIAAVTVLCASSYKTYPLDVPPPVCLEGTVNLVSDWRIIARSMLLIGVVTFTDSTIALIISASGCKKNIWISVTVFRDELLTASFFHEDCSAPPYQ